MVTALLVLLALTTGCGYHTTAKGSSFPQVHTLAVPMFVNQTQDYRIEQILTSAVVREFTTRTQYKILNKEGGDADATLKGVVVLTQTAPVTYDSTTGRASTSMVTVSMKVT